MISKLQREKIEERSRTETDISKRDDCVIRACETDECKRNNLKIQGNICCRNKKRRMYSRTVVDFPEGSILCMAQEIPPTFRGDAKVYNEHSSVNDQ